MSTRCCGETRSSREFPAACQGRRPRASGRDGPAFPPGSTRRRPTQRSGRDPLPSVVTAVALPPEISTGPRPLGGVDQRARHVNAARTLRAGGQRRPGAALFPAPSAGHLSSPAGFARTTRQQEQTRSPRRQARPRRRTPSAKAAVSPPSVGQVLTSVSASGVRRPGPAAPDQGIPLPVCGTGFGQACGPSLGGMQFAAISEPGSAQRRRQ